jgi:hypothetical protein
MLEAQFADFFMNLDWNRYKASDGTVDPEKVMADRQLQASAGDMYPRVLSAIAQMNAIQVQSKEILECLPSQERAELIGVICALQQEQAVIRDHAAGRQNVQKALHAWAIGASEPAPRVAQYFGQIPLYAPQGKLAQGLQSFLQLTLLTGNSERAQQEPNKADVYRELFANWMPTDGALRN